MAFSILAEVDSSNPWLQSVRVATTANITLSGTQTVDGVALSVGDLVLVNAQTTGSQNGFWIVSAGAWTRYYSSDAPQDYSPGQITYVKEGTVNGKSLFSLSTIGAIVVGTTSVTYTRLTPAPGSSVPSGTTGQTLRNNSGVWEASSFLYNSSTAVGINSVAPSTGVTLDVNGILEAGQSNEAYSIASQDTALQGGGLLVGRGNLVHSWDNGALGTGNTSKGKIAWAIGNVNQAFGNDSIAFGNKCSTGGPMYAISSQGADTSHGLSAYSGLTKAWVVIPDVEGDVSGFFPSQNLIGNSAYLLATYGTGATIDSNGNVYSVQHSVGGLGVTADVTQLTWALHSVMVVRDSVGEPNYAPYKILKATYTPGSGTKVYYDASASPWAAIQYVYGSYASRVLVYGVYGGNGQIAGGVESSAYGYGAVSLGYAARSYNFGAFSAGVLTQALSRASSALGEGTIASSYADTVIGTYNTPIANSLFEIGMGTGPSARVTAAYVLNTGVAVFNYNLLTTARLGVGFTDPTAPTSKLHIYREASGAFADGMSITVKDTAAASGAGVTHSTRFFSEQQGAGIARTFFYAASPTTGTTRGQFNIVSEDGTGAIFAVGSQNGFAQNHLNLFNISNVEQVRLNTSGSSYFIGGAVGIGTTAPGQPFVVNDVVYESIPALGYGSGKKVAFSSTVSAEVTAIMFGITTNKEGWIQNQRIDGNTTALNLLLQPSGGLVGIHTQTPTEKLHLGSGTIRLAAFTNNGYVLTHNATGVVASSSPASVLAAAGGTTGTGTANYVARWSSASNLTTGIIIDDGNNVAISTASNSNYRVNVGGSGAGSGIVVAAASVFGGASGGDYAGFGYNYRNTATTGSYLYNFQDTASRVEFTAGGFVFKTAPDGGAGSAGSAITWTNRFVILSAGNVGIDTASPTQKLHIATGTIRLAAMTTAGNVLIHDATGIVSSATPASIVTAGGAVAGSGTPNFHAKWHASTANTLTDSLLYDNGTNSGVGFTSNPFTRFSVKGVDTTGSRVFGIQDSAGSHLMQVLTTGFFQLGGGDALPRFFQTQVPMGAVNYSGGCFNVQGIIDATNSNRDAVALGWNYGTGNTSGQLDGVMIGSGATYNPGSGNATFNSVHISSVLNQVSATGISRGLFINDTLTLAPDYRALEMSNNSGRAIYQTGASATSNFVGGVTFGATTSPNAKVEVNAANLGGTTQDSTLGLSIRNPTPAISGTQQMSPPSVWEGQGWKTTATAASQSVRYQADVLPVQGAAAPTGVWRLGASIAGGAFSRLVEVTTAGELSADPTNGGAGSVVAGFTGGLKLSGSVYTLSRYTASGNGAQYNIATSSGYSAGHVFTGTTALITLSGNAFGIQNLMSFGAAAGSANFRNTALVYTINNSGAQTGNATGLFLNATETSLNGMTHNLFDFQVGGSSRLRLSSAGVLALPVVPASTGMNKIAGFDSSGYMTAAGLGANVTLNSTNIVALGGNITPTTITANTNSYNPTNWATSTNVTIVTTGGIWAITGFTAQPVSTVRRIINGGTIPFYLPCSHSSSDPTEQIMGGSDWIIPPGESVELLYDAAFVKWRVISSTFNPAQMWQSGAKGQYFFETAASVTNGDWGSVGFANANSGSAGVSTASGLPGGWGLSTGALATGESCVYFAKDLNTPTEFGAGHIVTSTLLHIPTLSDGTNTFTVQFALTSAPHTSPLALANQVGIRYSHGINSGNWQLFTRNSGGTETTADSGIAVVAGTMYVLTCAIDKARNEARYYINGALVGGILATMPAAAAQCGSRTTIVKTLGTAIRTVTIVNFSLLTVY